MGRIGRRSHVAGGGLSSADPGAPSPLGGTAYVPHRCPVCPALPPPRSRRDASGYVPGRLRLALPASRGSYNRAARSNGLEISVTKAPLCASKPEEGDISGDPV